MGQLTADNVVDESDDHFHPIDREQVWWTETSWFTANDPRHNLTLWFYPLFRPSIGVCSLLVAAWNGRPVPTWRLPYLNFEWHLPLPAGDLIDYELNGLRHRRLEPLRRYALAYDHDDCLHADLVFEGYHAPWLLKRDGRRGGHLNQTCRVSGQVVLDGQAMTIEAVGLRDRSWGPRHGNKTVGPAAMVWGVSSAHDQFVVNTGTATVTAPGGGSGDQRLPWGYVVSHGVQSNVRTASVTIVERAPEGYPTLTEMTLVDESGRVLELTGEARNGCALNWNPNAFCWVNMFTWSDATGKTYTGQHQGAMPDLARALR